MKILELCTSSGWGGLELYAWQAGRWLHQHKYPCVAVITSDSLLAERFADSGVQIVYSRPRFRSLPLLAAWRLARILDEQDIDILHVHWNKDLILAVLAKRFSRRRPKLVFIRHMALTRHKRDVYHRFIYNGVDKYLVITKRLYAEARRFLPLGEDKIELLYHGVPAFAQTDPAACQDFYARHHLPAQAFNILLPGRIEHYKGQHVLLEALQHMAQSGVNAHVVLLGHVMDEAYFTDLQQQVERDGLQDRVHYLGFVDKPSEIYGCFDVVVLTTYAETFGLVLVEAMKCGVAVIGTNAGGVPEIIEHGQTGLLYEPGDAAGLADCLQRLMDDESLRQRLARAGKDYADQVFSEQQHYAKLIQIFTDLTTQND